MGIFKNKKNKGAFITQASPCELCNMRYCSAEFSQCRLRDYLSANSKKIDEANEYRAIPIGQIKCPRAVYLSGFWEFS